MRLTAFFKLYKICILLHRCNLKIFAKNRFAKSAIFVKMQQKVCKCCKIWRRYRGERALARLIQDCTIARLQNAKIAKLQNCKIAGVRQNIGAAPGARPAPAAPGGPGADRPTAEGPGPSELGTDLLFSLSAKIGTKGSFFRILFEDSCNCFFRK